MSDERSNLMWLFGDFLSFSDKMNLDTGVELHWEKESQTSVTSIAASSKSICIVLSDLTAYSLGVNDQGQLGIGSREPASSFTKVIGSDFLSVACALDNVFWVSKDAKVHVAGRGASDTPSSIDGLRVRHLAAFGSTVAAIDEEFRVRLWPQFEYAKVSDCVIVSPPSVPCQISCGNGFASIIAKGLVFRVESGGELEHVAILGTDRMEARSAVAIDSCEGYTLVLDDENDVWLLGQVGNMVRKITTTPIAQDMRAVFAMPRHCALIKTMGVAVTFGENDAGQLGDGTRIKRTRPTETKVSYLTSAVVGGETFSVFLCSKFDPVLLSVNMDEFIPGYMSCPFEKAEDVIDQFCLP